MRRSTPPSRTGRPSGPSSSSSPSSPSSPTLVIGIGPAHGLGSDGNGPLIKPTGRSASGGKERGAPPGAVGTNPGGKTDTGKASPDEAIVIRSDSHCIDCRNYDPQTGQCEKVAGVFDPSDACAKYFEAGSEGEPDSDDTGGLSDADTDDQSDQSDQLAGGGNGQ